MTTMTTNGDDERRWVAEFREILDQFEATGSVAPKHPPWVRIGRFFYKCFSCTFSGDCKEVRRLPALPHPERLDREGQAALTELLARADSIFIKYNAPGAVDGPTAAIIPRALHRDYYDLADALFTATAKDYGILSESGHTTCIPRQVVSVTHAIRMGLLLNDGDACDGSQIIDGPFIAVQTAVPCEIAGPGLLHHHTI
jgi:hypothetical protein